MTNHRITVEAPHSVLERISPDSTHRQPAAVDFNLITAEPPFSSDEERREWRLQNWGSETNADNELHKTYLPYDRLHFTSVNSDAAPLLCEFSAQNLNTQLTIVDYDPEGDQVVYALKDGYVVGGKKFVLLPSVFVPNAFRDYYYHGAYTSYGDEMLLPVFPKTLRDVKALWFELIEGEHSNYFRSVEVD